MKADYGWILLVIAVVVVALLWPVLKNLFGATSDKVTNKDMYNRGLAVFNSDEIWPQSGPNKSCAACHDPAFVPAGTKPIEMTDYKEGQPRILEGLTAKYGSGMLSTKDPLWDKVHQCLTTPTRMFTGGAQRDSEHINDLMFYLRKEYK